MNAESSSDKSIAENESVIVVSDLHLGGEIDHCTKYRFCNFLEAISRFKLGFYLDEAQEVQIGSLTKYLMPPKKIILLGDILELWDCREQNRDNVILDAVEPFAKLREIDCDVIYVTGNHDENIGDIINCKKNDGKHPHSNAESIDLFTRGDKKFSIFKRSYIPKNKKTGLNVGGVYYAFLHGQQLDGGQITYTISKCLNTRFDPVSYVADIANNYVAKSIPFLVYWSIILTWIALVGVYFLLINRPIVGFLTWIIWGSAVILLSYDWYLFRFQCRKEVSNAQVPSVRSLAWITGSVSLIITGLLALGLWIPEIYYYLFLVSLAVYSYFFAVIAIPKGISFFQRPVYNFFKAKYKVKNKPVEKVISGNFVGHYFDPEQLPMTANVIIFGHTHCVEWPKKITLLDLPKDYPGPAEVLFYNTGCWERDSKQQKNSPCSYKDTFVYIDTEGVYLMRWDDTSGKIENLYYHSKERILHN